MLKQAISDSKILEAAKNSARWMNKNTGSSYKPKSFAERDAISKKWSRKFKQREMFNTVAEKILNDKALKFRLSSLLKFRAL
jgi:uncharacterized phage protein (TIGR02220 family)